VLIIPGVLHFVGLGKTPLPIEDAEIDAIRAATRAGLSVEPWPYLQAGQRVRIDDGPLAGVEGIYVTDSKQERIVVSVNLLKRSVAVAIERRWATPLDANGRPQGIQIRYPVAANQ